MWSKQSASGHHAKALPAGAAAVALSALFLRNSSNCRKDRSLLQDRSVEVLLLMNGFAYPSPPCLGKVFLAEPTGFHAATPALLSRLAGDVLQPNDTASRTGHGDVLRFTLVLLCSCCIFHRAC
jgi:hypothetical protein